MLQLAFSFKSYFDRRTPVFRATAISPDVSDVETCYDCSDVLFKLDVRHRDIGIVRHCECLSRVSGKSLFLYIGERQQILRKLIWSGCCSEQFEFPTRMFTKKTLLNNGNLA